MSDVDLLTLGRANLDLYGQEHGAAFVDVAGWDAMVGGSPVNVALAAARLQVRSGVLTAVGEDLVGDWVIHSLVEHGVETSFVVRKPGAHTSLALRAQRAPDHPLAFYRHDPADIHVTPEDLAGAPIEDVRAVLVSADALARGSMARACASVLARAADALTTAYLDLDLREVNWPDERAYAASAGAVVDQAEVVLGTEAEFAALLGLDSGGSPAALDAAVQARLLPDGTDRVVIVKRGANGATAFAGEETHEAAAFEVSEASTVGAGDSFAAGLITARMTGADWPQAMRFASACAAITVSRFGCSDGFPDLGEVTRFLDSQPALLATERS